EGAREMDFVRGERGYGRALTARLHGGETVALVVVVGIGPIAAPSARAAVVIIGPLPIAAAVGRTPPTVRRTPVLGARTGDKERDQQRCKGKAAQGGEAERRRAGRLGRVGSHHLIQLGLLAEGMPGAVGADGKAPIAVVAARLHRLGGGGGNKAQELD